MRDAVRRRQHQQPERVRECLDALGHVPAQTVPVDEVVNRAQCDVRVVAHPGGAKDDEHEEGEAAGDRKGSRVDLGSDAGRNCDIGQVRLDPSQHGRTLHHGY